MIMMPVALLCLLLILIFLFVLIGIPIITIVHSTKKNKKQILNNKSEQPVSLKYCSHCGTQVNDYAVVCLKCGCAINNSQPSNEALDEPSLGLNILSYFIPLVGLILYCSFKNFPKKANACGKCALIGFIMSIVLNLLVMIIYISLMNA